MNTAVRNFILLINSQSNEERMKSQQMELGSGGLSTITPCSITEGEDNEIPFKPINFGASTDWSDQNPEYEEWEDDYYMSSDTLNPLKRMSFCLI
jgi:hypothetical protein